MSCEFAYGCAFEDSGVSLMARVYGHAATVITQATISSITYTVTEHDTQENAEDGANGTSIITSTSLTVSAVVFDTLQTDARWTKDSTGYNFRYDSVAADRTNGGVWHRYEVKFTPSSGAVFHAIWIVESKQLARS